MQLSLRFFMGFLMLIMFLVGTTTATENGTQQQSQNDAIQNTHEQTANHRD